MKWEYEIMQINDHELLNLNTMGDEGWELVSVRRDNDYPESIPVPKDKNFVYIYIFKRPLIIN